MACINPDGTLTGTAKNILEVASEPRTQKEIAARLEQPLFKIRMRLREMLELGLIAEEGDSYLRTAEGRERLEAEALPQGREDR